MSEGRNTEFAVFYWEVRQDYDQPIGAPMMLGGPNKLELTAEVYCRGVDRHHPTPSKEDIGRAFGLLLGVDPERVTVR